MNQPGIVRQLYKAGQAATAAITLLADIRRGRFDLTNPQDAARMERVLEELEQTTKAIYGY